MVIKIESEEMLPDDLERLNILSIHKDTTRQQLRHHLRMVVRECQRLQGALMLQEALNAKREPHKVMTLEEYVALSLNGWHEVCKDIDGAGNVGIRFLEATG